MAYCRNCGAKLEKIEAYCPYCGERIAEVQKRSEIPPTSQIETLQHEVNSLKQQVRYQAQPIIVKQNSGCWKCVVIYIVLMIISMILALLPGLFSY